MEAARARLLHAVGRREDALAAAADRLARHGNAVAHVPADLSDPGSPATLISAVEAQIGPVTAPNRL